MTEADTLPEADEDHGPFGRPLFDDIVHSHEVGMRKPNPAIYQLALARLGAEPGRTAFLDDVLSNVVAAEAVGMWGVLLDEAPTSAVDRVRELAGLDRP